MVCVTYIEGIRGARAQAYDCKCDTLWVRYPLEEIQYLLFSLTRFGTEAKRDSHSTRNASRIRRKVGNGIS